MKARCYKPSNTGSYPRYGGRLPEHGGPVTMCDAWKSDMSQFISWAESNGYADTLSIDRKDNYKPYGPDNCRWTNSDIQANNTVASIMIHVGDFIIQQGQLAKRLGLLRRRLAYVLYLANPEYKFSSIDEIIYILECSGDFDDSNSVDRESLLYFGTLRMCKIIGYSPKRVECLCSCGNTCEMIMDNLHRRPKSRCKKCKDYYKSYRK